MNNDQNITKPTSEQIESKSNPMNLNPTGKGGFGDHPEHINRTGANRRTWSWGGLLEIGTAEEVATTTGGKVAIREVILKRLLKLATDGDLRAIEIIMDRMDGRAPQKVDLSNMGEKFNINIDGIIGLSKTTTETATGDPNPIQPKV
jgi:hypothetical protein